MVKCDVVESISPEGTAADAVNAVRKSRGEDELDAMDFLALMRQKMKLLSMDEGLLNRSVNEGFSGGEKKRNEIFHMAVMQPKLAILDETDSGLDIDALKIVANGVNALRSPSCPLTMTLPSGQPLST